MSSYYDVLGVGVDADLDEIRRAYHRKAQLLHPDRFAGSAPGEQEGAEAEMKALNAAWATLRNGDARRRYDTELGLIDDVGQDEAAEDDAQWEAEPQPRRSGFRRLGVPLTIALVLVAAVVATGIAMVAQAGNPSPQWSPAATTELRSAAINAGMTAPEADCLVRAITARYSPSDHFDWAVVQRFAATCR